MRSDTAASASVWAIVVAGGSGSRFGRPKQFELLAGRPVVRWGVDAARAVADGVVVVLPGNADARSPVTGATAAADLPELQLGADAVVAGGATRAESVRRGLARVPDDADVVVVHDAARPLASPGLFAAVVRPLLDGASAQVRCDGVVCAVAVADTLKRLAPDGTTIAETVAREELVAVQTPQAFRAAVLRRAHATGADATDDAALVEAVGGVVIAVAGEADNRKLTLPEDLELMEDLLARRREARGGAEGGAPPAVEDR